MNAKKKKGLSKVAISGIFRNTIQQFLTRNFGGDDGLKLLVSPDKKAVKAVLRWQGPEEGGVWRDDLHFEGHRDTIVSACWHGYTEPALAEESEGHNPLLQEKASDLRTIAVDLRTRLGETEDLLDKFDAREVGDNRTGVITRFLFGEYGACEVIRDGKGAFTLERGLPNRKDYLLMRDFDDGAIADDEEYARNLPKALKLFDNYFGYYKANEETGPAALFGNHAVDFLFYHLACPFTPTDIIPQVNYIGPGGKGKGTIIKQLGRIFGRQIMETGLDGATFTEGTEEVKGPRLLQARALLRGPRVAVALDGPKGAKLDTGFLKNACPKGEKVHVGGMFQSSISVDLRCLFIQISNELFRHNDTSGGTQRRQFVLRARNETFAGIDADVSKLMSDFDIQDQFAGLEPTVRRMLWETIKYFVEVCKCKMPQLPEILKQDQIEANKQSMWSLSADLTAALQPVPDDVHADDHLWDFRHSKHSKYLIRLGHKVSRAGVRDGRPVEMPADNKKAGDSYNGLLLLAKILMSAAGDKGEKTIKQSTISNLLDKTGYSQIKGEGVYGGVAHTDWLVEKLLDFYGNAGEVKDVLKALYKGGHCPLTEEQEAMLANANVQEEGDGDKYDLPPGEDGGW